MTNPEIHSGRFGVIGGVSAVENFSINDDTTLARFRNSATGGGMGSRAGVGNWNGTYNGTGAQPYLLPGLFIGFVGYTAPDSDIINTVGQAYTGTIIADTANIVWDWASGAVLKHSVGFSGHLALTVAAAHAAVLDATVSDPEPIGPCKISWSSDNGSTYTQLKNVSQAQLSINAANSSYINSDTAGNTGRLSGPIDWSASITIESNILGGGVLAKGVSYMFKFFTTGTKFYELKWGKVKGFTNFVTDVNGNIISHSVAIEMSATELVSSTPTIGHILLPDTTTYWGT